MSKTKGRVTLPSESGFLKETKELMERWGADAIRDSDGTKLDKDVKSLGAEIIPPILWQEDTMNLQLSIWRNASSSTLCPGVLQQWGNHLEMDFMEGYFDQQVVPDCYHDPKKWWEVMDRTTGQAVPVSQWELAGASMPEGFAAAVSLRVCLKAPEIPQTPGIPQKPKSRSCFRPHARGAGARVAFSRIHGILPGIRRLSGPYPDVQSHNEYWGDKPHEIPFDVRQEASGLFAREYLVQWLKDNPDTDVVRFTTFFYHFTLVFGSDAKEKFVDWFGYGATVSVKALEEFQAEYGYALRPEDIVDNGYYNSSFRVPTRQYRDYMDFIQRFVAEKARELVELVHQAGRKAMMFLGDNWIGTEPYGAYFPEIGLDAVVGSVGGGATLRLICRYSGGELYRGPFPFPIFSLTHFHDGK